jgi:hypothetical protein
LAFFVPFISRWKKSWGAFLDRLSVAAYKDFAKARGSGSDSSKLESGQKRVAVRASQRESLSNGDHGCPSGLSLMTLWRIWITARTPCPLFGGFAERQN